MPWISLDASAPETSCLKKMGDERHRPRTLERPLERSRGTRRANLRSRLPTTVSYSWQATRRRPLRRIVDTIRAGQGGRVECGVYFDGRARSVISGGSKSSKNTAVSGLHGATRRCIAGTDIEALGADRRRGRGREAQRIRECVIVAGEEEGSSHAFSDRHSRCCWHLLM